VLYELAYRSRPTATELCKDLGLDAGYLSRILRQFEKRGLLARTPSANDGRQSLLSLTAKGKKVFSPLDARANREIGSLVDRLTPGKQQRLVEAMRTVTGLTGADTPPAAEPYSLRTHQPGDMGWVVHRHGALYWKEYHYDERFEALVAKIVSEFIANFDPRRERCWIAERDGEIVASVFLVKYTKTVAKLRLLLVEPSARGLGIGRRLVAECVRFAREAGYKKITLWTQSELAAARHLYKQAGFRLAEKHPHADWSRDDLVSEVWDLEL
jgi:DNA-binding MarR family transcriptional regulator/N-acetylglutamate synthase-like GNAT family acetyltransferase